MTVTSDKAYFKEYAVIGKALANNNRLEIMSLIMQSKKTVETIAKETGLSVANVSKHLQTLLKARLVKNEKQKNFVFYEVANSRIEQLLTVFFEVAQEEIEQANRIKDKFENRSEGMDELTVEQLEEKMNADEIMLIDVRPSDEYEHAHIPGAVSMPIRELNDMLSDLPENTTIVAYCRGAHCLMSSEAIEILEKSGRSAVRLSQGVHEWKLYKKELA